MACARSSCAALKLHAHVAHLTWRTRSSSARQGFRQRHERVAVVQLQQVDVVATDALQTGLYRAQDVRATEATSLGRAGAQTHLVATSMRDSSTNAVTPRPRAARLALRWASAVSM